MIKKQYVVTSEDGEEFLTFAVSPEKAINNIRYRMYMDEGCWYKVPDFDTFEASELCD